MKFRILVFTGVFVCLASGALAQGLRYESFFNWNLGGSGARACAMGGAFLAVSDDGSAGSWNPAGLPYNEGTLTSISYNVIHSAVDNNPRGFGEASENSTSVGMASFVSPLTVREKEFVIAVTYNRLQDIFYEDGFVSQAAVVDSLDFNSRARAGGNLSNINLGFGTEIFSNITFGAGVNIIGGDRRDDYNHRVIPAGLIEGEEFDSVFIDAVADVDYSGLFGNFGLMYRTDTWSSGLVFTTPYVMTEQLDFQTSMYSFTDLIPSDQTTVLYKTEREIEVPWSVGMGFSVWLKENFLIAVDYQFRKFKDGTFSTQQITDPDLNNDEDGILSPASSFTDFPTKWYNLHQVRAGMEYTFETGYGRIPVRVGVHNTPSVAGNTTGTTNRMIHYYSHWPVLDLMTFPGSTSEQEMGMGFAFGAGIHWTQIYLDFAFEFESSSSTDSGDFYFAYSENGIPPYEVIRLGDYSREYKNAQSRFVVNFTGYF